MFEHTFSYEIQIDAPPPIVWRILADFGKYPEWHPFTPLAEIDGRVGGRVRQEVIMVPGKKPIIHRARVSRWDENAIMAWKMHYGPLIRAERSQVLTLLDNHTTLYRTEDINRGILVPWVKRKYGPSIDRGFRELSIALKERAEAIHSHE